MAAGLTPGGEVVRWCPSDSRVRGQAAATRGALPGAFSEARAAAPSSRLVPFARVGVVVTNEWGEHHALVGDFSSSDAAVDWIADAEQETGNRGYKFAVLPLIPPGEYKEGAWLEST